jgi:hypothetical protein
MITYNRSANGGDTHFAEFAMALPDRRRITVKAYKTMRSHYRISIDVGDTATVNIILSADAAASLGRALTETASELAK